MCVQAKSLQSRPILCSPMECSPPGSSVHGIFQARILKCVAMPSSRGSSRPRDQPMSLMSPALAGGLFTTSSTWEAPQGAHIKPNCPKALSHQRASRGTRQTLPQTFSKGAGPFSYCVLFFPGCTGCKILFSALVCLSHQIQALASLSLTQEDFWGWE